jgi:rare lipoprotein A
MYARLAALAVACLLPFRPAAAYETGYASYYAHRHHGRAMANGQPFNMHADTAAHRSLPLGSRVLVTNTANGRTATVTITDRGPYSHGRVIDVSLHVADVLHMRQAGTARVELRLLP